MSDSKGNDRLVTGGTHMGALQGSNGWWRHVLAVVSLGMLLGSVWASRDQTVFSTAAFIPLNRVMSMLVLLGIAAMGERLAVSSRGFALVGTIAFAVHVVAVAMALVVTDSMTLVALGVASTCFEGVAIAALEMVVLRYALSLGAQGGAVLVAVAFLVGQVWDCVFMDAGAVAATAQWLAGSAVAYGVLWMLLKQTDPEGATSQPAEPQGGGQPLFDRAHLVVLLFIVVVLVQYGLTQGFTGFGGIGSLAHYGLAAGVVMVVVRTAVVCLCALRLEWRADRLVSLIMVLWIASLGVTLCTWGTEARVVADWMRTGVYYALQVLPLAVALACAAARPVMATPMLAAGMAIATSNQVARFAGWAMDLGALAHNASQAVAVLAGGMVLSAVAAAVAYTVLFSRTKDAQPVSCAVPAVRAEDSTVEQAVAFAHCFDAVCAQYDVPRGEREVLLQAVHGYTIDNIATNLGLSRETVKTNLSRAYTRMGINGKQAFLGLLEQAR